jgi:hypothetical protein
MSNIICHIVGINNVLKDDFVKHVSKYKNVIIKDLDIITNNIRSDQIFANFVKKMDNNNLPNNKQKIYKLWKELLTKKINDIAKRNNKYKIIFIGLSTFHKNHKIYININTKNKFFVNINSNKNAKDIIQYNLDKYRKFIIDGSFPLNYINYKFIVEQRNNLINIYKNINFKLKSIYNIYKWLDIWMSQYDSEHKNIASIIGQSSDLFIGSINNYDNIIKFNTIQKKHRNSSILSKILGTSSNINYGYTDKWLALIFSITNINKYIKKGIVQIGNKNYPTIKEKFKNAFDVLNSSCYIYTANNNNFEKVNSYKYKPTQSIIIKHKEYVKNIYDMLSTMNVKFIKAK